MPIFEYKCNDCGFVTEFLQKSFGKENHVCKKCKSPNIQKLFSPFAVVHKNYGRVCDWMPDGKCPDDEDICPPGTCPHA